MARELIGPGTVRGEWWRSLGDGRIECELCPRACTLRDGQRGFCFVREARDGQMILSSYGRASGFCIDPIEKKPLNHFFPGTSVLSFGTAGCNLGCKFCQNWDISKAKESDRLASWAAPEEIATAAREHGCKSLAFTYNDPVIFAEYAIDCARAASEQGIKTVAVSAGYITERARPDFFAAMDAANIDLKGFTERFYRKLCFAHLEPVLETLRWVHAQTDTWLEVTNLLIPGQNDSPEEVEQLCEWFMENLGPDVPLHFTAFHPDYKLDDCGPTPPGTLARARMQARRIGLRYVYTGNIHDPEGQSTPCAGCGAEVIGRDRYDILQWNLSAEGCCLSCKARMPGHFAPRPSTCGSRRRRIEIVT